ncbi:TAXI family TRAP transporter solute-binding subunit [Microvirga massiliensis]|uniref:TAXI family TRAP transporter solute-binding subunit n=1 Tax=Microvirga massiliensis TaxID=1033741 RepID=UPI00062B8B7C|nr:TAXI family TRAP transporter solute-binding subunit [Microvirga massiliensis]
MLKTMLLAAATTFFAATGAQAAEIRLMTGPQGGVWVPLGGQLKDMWEKAIPGTSVQSLPGAGIANVRGIEEGKTEVGFGNSISTVDALMGNPPFTKPHKKVCNVATLYPQYFQVLVPADSGIEKVTDLKGKPITTQPRGNTGELITQQLLKAHGMSYNDVKVSFVSYTDSVEQMKDGHAQAFSLGTAIPSGSVMDLAAARDVKLLDLSGSLPEMKKMNPGYTLVTVPKGTYPKQDTDVKVIGYATHIVASCDMPEDTVYRMTKAMAEHVPSMAATNKAMAGLTPKEMAEDIGVPFHPGAARFYKEQGIGVKTM